MTIAFVASTKYNSGANGGTSSPGIDTSGANLILISEGHDTDLVQVQPTDNKSNTYFPRVQTGTASGLSLIIWECVNPTVGTGHTFSISNTGKFPQIYVAAFSGAAASPFDQSNNSSDLDPTTNIQPGSVTPSEDNELIFTGTMNLGAGLSIDSGFTIVDSDDFGPGNNYGGGIAYLIQTTATAENPTWSMTSYTINAKSAVIATYKAAASGSSVPVLEHHYRSARA